MAFGARNQAMAENDSQNKFNLRSKEKRVRSVGDVVGSLMEPVLARRTGMTLDLIRAWPEICGNDFATTTRPLKIDWPRRAHEDDPFEPASLIVACEPSVALFFQHEQAVLIERINLFFGFAAIKRVRIQQKPVADTSKPQKGKAAELSKEEAQRLQNLLAGIADPELRQKMEKLGRGIIIADRS